MNKSHFINLTLSVYRVTDLFPEKEPLCFLVRKKILDILRDLVLADHYLNDSLLNNKQAPLETRHLMGQAPLEMGSLTGRALIKPLERVLKNVAVLGVYFNIAEKQNWVKPENFLVLKAEYGAIEKDIKRLRQEKIAEGAMQAGAKGQGSQKSRARISSPTATVGLKNRQQRILQLLKELGNAQVQDLKKALPQVTKRTLRRDMDFLLKRGLVARLGDKIKTEYKLKV